MLFIKEKNGRIDLQELMEILGAKGIDSILLEGGGVLNESALSENIVQKSYVYIAPKIFGGEEAKTPVSGKGVSYPKEAYPFVLEKVQQLGADVLLEYRADI